MPVDSATLRYLLLPGVAVCVQAWAGDDIVYNGEASLHADDNVSTAWREKDVREDTVFSGRFGAGYGSQLSSNSGIGYRGGAEYQGHAEFDKLNALVLNAGIDYRFRTGRSFLSPTWTASLTAREKFADSVIRDSTTIDVKFELFKRFTELTAAVFGIGYSTEEAEGVAFDQDRARLYANVDLMLSQRDTLFITYVYVDGDVVSTGTADSLLLTNAAEVIEPDDAFGDGSVTGPIAYRLDAQTHILSAGYNYTIDHGSSIDFSIRMLNSSADANIDYDSLVIRASYLIQFE